MENRVRITAPETKQAGSQVLNIIAWAGAGIMIFSAALYIWVNWFVDHTQNPLYPTMDFSFALPIPFALMAVPLMLAGGLLGKPRHYWPAALLSGIFYIVIFFPIVQNDIYNFQHTAPGYRDLSRYSNLIYSFLPGLFLMIEGVILCVRRDKAAVTTTK